MENLTDLQKFYFGKTIFITGGTGYLGKLLIGKLLRCCPGLKKLYLLVREKKDKNMQERLDELWSDLIFDRLKQEVPDFKKKVALISGDCSRPDLGISATDKEIIMRQVNIIFHSAATVRFHEPLETAINSNVRATSDLLQIAKNVQNLQAFMYLSTAYSNVPLSFIKEEFYDVEQDWRTVLDMITNEEDIDIKKILGGRLNTYTFTKALAENEIHTNSGNVPVGILRPAMVISTYTDPVRNWINNLYGPTGVVVAAGKGVLRTLEGDKDVTAEVVPADFVVNCLLAAARGVYESCKLNAVTCKPLIFNYVSSVENKITWGQFREYFMTNLDEYPYTSALWYKSLNLHKHEVLNRINAFFEHFLPALVADVFAILTFQKPKFFKIYKKMKDYTLILTFFTTTEIKFCNKRTRELWKNCSDLDKQLFPFSMAEFDWSDYFKEYILGVRRYLMREPDEQLPQARRKYRRLYYLHCIIKLSISVIFLCVVSYVFLKALN